jgi:hypothetical protein
MILTFKKYNTKEQTEQVSVFRIAVYTIVSKPIGEVKLNSQR